MDVREQQSNKAGKDYVQGSGGLKVPSLGALSSRNPRTVPKSKNLDQVGYISRNVVAEQLTGSPFSTFDFETLV